MVGSAGSQDKIDFLKSIGFDDAFNYKSGNLSAQLTKVFPNGIDVYFDNVGGEMLDAVLENMNAHGIIIACGAISMYNSTPESMYRLKNMVSIVKNRLTIQGFIIGDYMNEFTPAIMELVKLIESGKLVVKETIREGFENTVSSFIDLFRGSNIGKMIVKLE